MSKLNLSLNSLLANPLERKLVKVLLKPEYEDATIEFQSGIWTINNKRVSYDPYKKYSPIKTFVLKILHLLHGIVSPAYKKKFKAVVEKLRNAKLVPGKFTQILFASKKPEEEKIETDKSHEEKSEIKIGSSSEIEIKVRSKDNLSDRNSGGELKEYCERTPPTATKAETKSLEEEDAMPLLDKIDSDDGNPGSDQSSLEQPETPHSNDGQVDTEDDKIEVKSEIKPSSIPILNEQSELFLSTIESHLGKDACEIWSTLLNTFLNHYKEDLMIECKLEKSTLSFKFKHTMKIWFSSTNEKGEEYPFGGIIFCLASNRYPYYKDKYEPYSVTIQLEKNKLLINHGIEAFVRTPEKFLTHKTNLKKVNFLNIKAINKFIDETIPEYIHSRTEEFENRAEGFFAMKGSFKSSSDTKVKKKEDYKANWGSRGKVLPENEKEQQYIQKYIAEKK